MSRRFAGFPCSLPLKISHSCACVQTLRLAKFFAFLNSINPNCAWFSYTFDTTFELFRFIKTYSRFQRMRLFKKLTALGDFVVSQNDLTNVKVSWRSDLGAELPLDFTLLAIFGDLLLFHLILRFLLKTEGLFYP